MKYIIDEDELEKLVRSTHSHDLRLPHYFAMEDFLKSKKPVEEIASGEVGSDDFYADYMETFIDGAEKFFKKYNGKSIKLYIEEKE